MNRVIGVVRSGNDLLLVELEAGDYVRRRGTRRERRSSRFSTFPISTSEPSTSVEDLVRVNVVRFGFGKGR